MKKSPRGGLWPSGLDLERVKGIEPSYEAWEAAVLPLNYTRSAAHSSLGWAVFLACGPAKMGVGPGRRNRHRAASTGWRASPNLHQTMAVLLQPGVRLGFENSPGSSLRGFASKPAA